MSASSRAPARAALADRRLGLHQRRWGGWHIGRRRPLACAHAGDPRMWKGWCATEW